ncbi:MAG: DUF2520 domain-containing protein [Ignavibacteria bacterium]|nr:DUF2520 domain-containing protein [Ignavibacteria bacterium]
MKISIIGIGNVGSAFAIELKRTGNEIISLVDNSTVRAKKIGKIIGCNNVFNCISNPFIPKSDLILICVSDRDIKGIAAELKKAGTLKDTVIAHTSGVLPSAILKSSGIKSANIASFHPIQTLPYISMKDNKLLSGIYFGIEGGPSAVRKLKNLVKKLKSKYIMIPSDKKSEYHLSCVLASNFVIANFYLSANLSKSLGIPEKKLFDSQKPLLMKTIENIREYGVVKSVTGPVERGDIDTVKKHLDLLHSKFPNFVEYYKQVSVILSDVSRKKNKKTKNVNKIFDR